MRRRAGARSLDQPPSPLLPHEPREEFGGTLKEIVQRIQEDDQIYEVLDPERIMAVQDSSKQPASTLTYCQKQKLRNREAQYQNAALQPGVLDSKLAESVRERLGTQGQVSQEQKSAAQRAWMAKLRNGDYSGPTLDVSRYLAMRNQEIKGNPRQTEEYRKKVPRSSRFRRKT